MQQLAAIVVVSLSLTRTGTRHAAWQSCSYEKHVKQVKQQGYVGKEGQGSASTAMQGGSSCIHTAIKGMARLVGIGCIHLPSPITSMGSSGKRQAHLTPLKPLPWVTAIPARRCFGRLEDTESACSWALQTVVDNLVHEPGQD